MSYLDHECIVLLMDHTARLRPVNEPCWRKEWDSNPRSPCGLYALAGRCITTLPPFHVGAPGRIRTHNLTASKAGADPVQLRKHCTGPSCASLTCKGGLDPQPDLGARARTRTSTSAFAGLCSIQLYYASMLVERCGLEPLPRKARFYRPLRQPYPLPLHCW